MKELINERKGQTSLEMLLLLGGVIAVAAVVALVIKGIVQNQIIPLAEEEFEGAVNGLNWIGKLYKEQIYLSNSYICI